MDLFRCSPLATLACLVVLLYLHGRNLLFTFIFMDLFECSPYLQVLILVFAFNYLEFFGCSLLTTWTCLAVLLYLY